MKKTIIKSGLLLASTFAFFLSQAQWKDSASYKQAMIQYYKQQTTGLKTYRYVPNAYTKEEQDTMFINALLWKKQTIEYPVILSYYNLTAGTPAADAKIRYLEDTISKKEYSELLTKAADAYVAKTKTKKPARHVAPGLSTSKNPSGKVENKDNEIKDQILKTWKF
ncbi:MAG TPA: hypothetical protein VF610_00550 [Segetibacter sp.]|jgi:hypothetical protein